MCGGVSGVGEKGWDQQVSGRADLRQKYTGRKAECVDQQQRSG